MIVAVTITNLKGYSTSAESLVNETLQTENITDAQALVDSKKFPPTLVAAAWLVYQTIYHSTKAAHQTQRAYKPTHFAMLNKEKLEMTKLN
jgi:hypothetical protein